MQKKAISKMYALVIALIIIIAAIAGAVWYAMQGTTTTPAKQFKFAAIMPGPVNDADYNSLGLLCTQAVGDAFQIPYAYSERVAVPDSETALRQYVGQGYNIIWVHGTQFNTYALKVAADFPDVSFICEIDSPIANATANIWTIDKKFWYGMYGIGALAAMQTKTNKIGYVLGVALPWSVGTMNAMQQAIDVYNPNATLKYVVVGDFNDPAKARLATEAMVADGEDVVVGAVNMGIYGVFEALRASGKNGTVWMTGINSDKRDMLLQYYMTAVNYNYTIPVLYAINRTIGFNEKGGYTSLEYGTTKGQYVQLPINLVSADVQTGMADVCTKLENGTANVTKNLTTLDPRIHT